MSSSGDGDARAVDEDAGKAKSVKDVGNDGRVALGIVEIVAHVHASLNRS